MQSVTAIAALLVEAHSCKPGQPAAAHLGTRAGSRRQQHRSVGVPARMERAAALVLQGIANSQGMAPSSRPVPTPSARLCTSIAPIRPTRHLNRTLPPHLICPSCSVGASGSHTSSPVDRTATCGLRCTLQGVSDSQGSVRERRANAWSDSTATCGLQRTLQVRLLCCGPMVHAADCRQR